MKTSLPYFKKMTSVIILMFLFAFAQKSYGQTASATWQPATSSSATVVPTIVGNITAGSLTSANLGSGLNGTNSTHSSTYGIGGNAWNTSNTTPTATSSNDYIQFQVAPSVTGNTFLISSLSFDIYSNDNGDQMAIYYSTSSSFTSSSTLVTGYAFNGSNTYTNSSLSIAVASGTTLYFRVMFYSVSSTSYTLGIKSNLQISGSTFGAASKLVFTTQPTSTVAAASITPAITVAVEDASGNIVTNDTRSIALTIATNPGGGTLSGTTTVAASAGVATFSGISIDKIGTGYTLKATGTLTATSSTFNITIGTASKLTFVAQPTSAVAGATISPSITVQVQDAGGNLVTTDTRNVTLSIGTNPGGGTLSGTATIAAVGGVATFSTLSINKSGTGYTLTATSSPTLTGSTSSTFNITAGTASKLVFGTQPSNAVAGASITPAITVQIEDVNGNIVSATTSITLAIGTNPGSGTLSGTATVAASAGTATFTGLSINKVGTGYTLTAAATSLSGATSNTFNITVGAASKLVFNVQPVSTTATTVISPAITVQVQDANGNLVSSSTSITLAIGANPGGGTLSGTATVAASAGTATFSTLSINKVGTAYTLTATATSLTGATSSTFNITLNVPSKLVFNGQPTNTVAGSTISPAVTVQIQDAGGNLETADARNITLAFGTNPSGATLGGTTTIAAVAGIATFSNLSITKTGTGYTFAATSSPALTGATSSAFNITPAALASLTMSTVGDPEPVDSVFTSAVTITGKDAYGNLENSGTLTMTTNAGSITPASVTLGTNGSVTVSTFKVTQSGSGETITATSGSIFVTSNTFTVSSFNSSASGDYYRSNGSGNWATAATWQGSHDGTNWYACTSYPSSTATSIVIQSAHTINIATAVSSSALTVSGKLNVNAGGNLSSNGITTSTASTLLVNANGTYTHNQDGGTIPTATWDVASICYVSGIANTTPSGLSQTFGSYTWDCGGQTDDVEAPLPATVKGNLTIKNSNGYYITLPSTVTVSGNFYMNGGTLGIVCNTTFFGTASQTGTLNIAGNFTMTAGTLEAFAGSGVFSAPNATFNINFTGTSTQLFSKTGGSITEVNGGSFFGNSSGTNNFTVNNHAIVDFGTSQLDGASNFTIASGGTIITANPNGLTQSGTGSTGGTIVGTAAGSSSAGTRSYNSGATYVYDAIVSQVTGVFTTTTANTVTNLTINNAAGVTLSQPLAITGILSLTNGLLTTTATNLLSMGAASSVNLAVSDYTNTSYVNGPIQKTGSTAFTFPVGKSSVGYVPIAITNTSNSASQIFRAEYIPSSAAALGPIASGSSLQRVSGCDYWNLNLYNSSGTQISALTSGTIGVTLFWNPNNSCNVISDLSTLAIGHFATSWDVIGLGAYTATGSTTNGSITYTGASNFSPFALATTNGVNNPLPIILDYFTATKEAGYNKLAWKVECTSSSSSFDVERSYDGSNFETINTVKVTSATDCALPFVYNDYNSNGNKVYYRIKMVDIDDNAKYSNIELISNDANAIGLMSINPNPVVSDASLKISSSADQNIELVIISIDGKQMQHKTMQVQSGANTVSLQTSGLAKGIYIIKGMFSNGQISTIKFIKQ